MTQTVIGPMAEIGIKPDSPLVERHWLNRAAWKGHTSRQETRSLLALAEASGLSDRDILRVLRGIIQCSPVGFPALKTSIDRLLTVSSANFNTELMSWVKELKAYGLPKEVDTERFAWAYQMLAFAKKYPFGDTDCDRLREDEGLRTFWVQERKNQLTNRRWREESESGFFDTLVARVDEFLGEPPSWNELCVSGDFGPGTAEGFNFDHTRTSPAYKLATQLTHLPGNTDLALLLLNSSRLWRESVEGLHGREACVVVPGSSQFTVRKDALVNRVCFKEPLVELFLQHGLGRAIRTRFKAEQRDLSVAWTTNQKLARLGSLTGIWATVDLSSASDSITTCMVSSIMSGEKSRKWYEIMQRLRCKTGSCIAPSTENLERFRHRFELFSSMGNGFTWELESMLFYCVLTSIVPGVWVKHHDKDVLRWPHIGVYGDDLVFPGCYADRVYSTLEWLGFTVNGSKSFVSGPFRESCGADYHSGIAVRPLAVKQKIDNCFDLIGLANRMLLHSEKAKEDGFKIFGRLKTVWHGLVQSLPPLIAELNATPIGIPDGLWSPGLTVLMNNRIGPKGWRWNPSFTTAIPSLGWNPQYRLIVPKARSVNLLEEKWCFDGVSYAANGQNLLAAKLLAMAPKELNKWATIENTGASGERVGTRGRISPSIGWRAFC